MIPYPREVEEPCPVCLVSLGGAGADLIDLSGVIRDYPHYRGRPQLSVVRADTDAARLEGRPDGVLLPVPDGSALRENAPFHPELLPFMRPDAAYASSTSGARSMAEGRLAAIHGRAKLHAAIRVAVTRLADLAKAHQGDRATVRLVVVGSAASNTGPGAFPVAAEIGQTQRAEVARHGVNLERWTFLMDPSVDDDRRAQREANAAALYVELSLAQRYGLEVAPGRILRGPIAEMPLAYGALHASLEAFEHQKMHAAATLRALLHPNLGARVRSVLRRMPDLAVLADDPHIARSVGYAVLGFDRVRALDLLSDICLAETDRRMSLAPIGGAS
jgi:hypothetical protein